MVGFHGDISEVTCVQRSRIVVADADQSLVSKHFFSDCTSAIASMPVSFT